MKVATFVLVVLMVVLPAVGVADQTAPVRLVGAVQWIGGLGMARAVDAGGSIRIDLTSVGQADYRGLTSGDRIVVTGVLSPRHDRVIATAIAPDR